MVEHAEINGKTYTFNELKEFTESDRIDCVRAGAGVPRPVWASKMENSIIRKMVPLLNKSKIGYNVDNTEGEDQKVLKIYCSIQDLELILKAAENSIQLAGGKRRRRTKRRKSNKTRKRKSRRTRKRRSRR